MEDEDPEPAFETIERGPLADFDDDELRGILARADLDAEDDDEDFLDDDDDDDEDDDEEELGEGAARRAPMSTSAALDRRATLTLVTAGEAVYHLNPEAKPRSRVSPRLGKPRHCRGVSLGETDPRE